MLMLHAVRRPASRLDGDSELSAAPNESKPIGSDRPGVPLGLDQILVLLSLHVSSFLQQSSKLCARVVHTDTTRIRGPASDACDARTDCAADLPCQFARMHAERLWETMDPEKTAGCARSDGFTGATPAAISPDRRRLRSRRRTPGYRVSTSIQ